MGFESESLWSAMRGPHYIRISHKLKLELEIAENLEESLAISLCNIVRAAHAEVGTFWFYDRFGENKVMAKACCGGVDLSSFVLIPGEGIAGKVIENGQSVIIEDCQNDPRWNNKVDQITGFKTISMICVPVMWNNIVFGCMQIINKTDHEHFDEMDLEFISNLAEYVSALFNKFNLLDHYEEGIEVKAQIIDEIQEPTFTTIFDTDSFADVEYDLMLSERFNELPTIAQKNVLRHMREVWLILKKNPQEKGKKISKGFGFLDKRRN